VALRRRSKLRLYLKIGLEIGMLIELMTGQSQFATIIRISNSTFASAHSMDRVVFESVRKAFRSQPAFFNWMGRERPPETVALRNLSFATCSGEVLVLLGPNGSGKTTTLKLISTMLLPDAGSVCVAGFDAQRHAWEVRRRVGIAVAAERSFFPRLSARENLEFFASLDDVPRSERAARIREVLHETGLDQQADTLVMKFSSGMYQRLGIARALLKRPGVLLLDEPTRSLDPASTAHFWSTIRELARQQTSILLATHNFAEAVAAGDRLLLLQRGELLADQPIGPGDSVEELRSFYFRSTGEIDEAAGAIARAGD
jgi:ABC-type multidrug transport system ATPase subunit